MTYTERALWEMFCYGFGFACLLVAMFVWWRERPFGPDEDIPYENAFMDESDDDIIEFTWEVRS